MMAHDLQQFALIEKTTHLNYLRDFRVEQCQLFLQHKCTQHRPFTCFYWHFQNQRRRRPYRRLDGTFSYDPDFYCNDYDEQSGLCPKGDDCLFLHRNANDTEKRFHLRYFKTGMCTHETDSKGHCLKNGLHCSYAHGLNDLRQPVLDSRELQSTDLALERLARLCISLENERALNDDPKWTDSHYVLANYKTEPCKRPPRLCRQGYACPQYHNPRDRRRNPSIFKYKSTPCPHVKQGDEWIDPTVCETGDSCKYCHTRTEQQFHPEIYKSTKCNDVSVTSYCPRGPFCAFAHIEQELKSYRDFDLHHPSELPLSSFIPIPEEKEMGPDLNVSSSKSANKKSSAHEIAAQSSSSAKKIESSTTEKNNFVPINPSSGSLPISELLSSMPTNIIPPISSYLPNPSPFLNDSMLIAGGNIGFSASHSYPPPSSYLSSIVAASNLLSSINAHFHSIAPSSNNVFEEKKDFQDQRSLEGDVKDLIGSSLTAIGLDRVDENDFDKASTGDMLIVDSQGDGFARSDTPATNEPSPTQFIGTSAALTRPMNIPNSFPNDHFSYSSSAKSPFDAPNSLFDETLESPIDAPFPEPSTSSGTGSRPGELYKMAGFSQDLPIFSRPIISTSPQSIFQRFNSTTTNSLSTSASSTEMDLMRNRVLQMQALAMTEKESSEHWRREAEENHRLALQLEAEKQRAIQQRDQALHQIEQMRHFLLQNLLLFPNDIDLMQWSLDDVHMLQRRIQEELTKLSSIEQTKTSNASPARPTGSTSHVSHQRSNKHHHQHHHHHHPKHDLVSSSSKP